MKAKALVDGFDGITEYKAGDILETDSNHLRVLLHNNLADPLDEQACAICAAVEAMSEEAWAAHHLSSDAHWDRGDEARARAKEVVDVSEATRINRVVAPKPHH